jgi:multiple sugar transport system ATP-binding protein
VAEVRLVDVTKRFGKVVAVNKMNLDVKDREFMVLLGPSGCGKTTALRCVAGLEDPDEGQIYIGGRKVNDLDPKERNIAMVFQTYALYPHLTVFKNLAFPLENAKIPKDDIEKKVREVARLLKIEQLLDRKPKQLSGGQRQRVALGRAIIREPKAFLMDEPLSNLDAKLRVYMRAELKKLQRDIGITTIYVTHDQVEAMTMGDRIAIMNEGILQQTGTPDEIYFHPSNIFVAGFIGSPPTNFFDCALSEDDALTCKEFKLSLPKNVVDILRESGSEEYVLGVRPQDTIVSKKAERAKNYVKSVVEVVEPIGDQIILDLKVGDYPVKAVVSPDFKAETGEEFWITFSIDKVHVFDRNTGKALL